MAIEFHCSHCGQMIRTAAEHAGKRGKCPHCQNTVYVPSPDEDIEPLELTPIDETHERELKRRLDESRELSRTIRGDQSGPPEGASGRAAPADDEAPGLPVDIEVLVQDYVLHMFKGELNEAQEIAAQVRRHKSEAYEYIQRLAADDLPPDRLARVPRPVMQGFLKQLQSES
jgi:phage FluMu protein Com